MLNKKLVRIYAWRKTANTKHVWKLAKRKSRMKEGRKQIKIINPKMKYFQNKIGKRTIKISKTETEIPKHNKFQTNICCGMTGCNKLFLLIKVNRFELIIDLKTNFKSKIVDMIHFKEERSVTPLSFIKPIKSDTIFSKINLGAYKK